MAKQITLRDFLTDMEIKQVVHIWEADRKNFHQRVIAEIIEPHLARINRLIGQENDPDYLAYAIEFILTRASGQ